MAEEPAPGKAVPEGVFAYASFAIVRSESLNDEDARQIEEQITLHGGEVVYDNYPETKLRLDDLTHIISATFDFPDYYDAIEQFKQVVRPEWVEASVAMNKLAHPRRYSPDPNLIMSEVVATCADLPEGDKDAIVGGILAMGGNYSPKLTTQVTHVVALDMNSDIVEQALSYELDILIVLPHWFDECLKLGKKIDEEPYLLPNADTISRPGDEPPTSRPNEHVKGATSSTPRHSKVPSLGGRKSLKVFKSKKVLLDSDLKLSESIRHIIHGIIHASGGGLVNKISDADILICKYRSGINYTTATARKIEVGSLSWLYFMIVHDVWTSPFRRLLHYPIPKEPLPGFEGLKISVSNYGGEARTYLENLITASGAERTKTLKQDNTHLITAHTKSEKVDAAREWNIAVVNHLWLEESYAQWEMQSVTNPRYCQFPHKTNLGEVVGQTSIDRKVIERRFLPQEDNAPETPASRRGRTRGSSILDTASPARANARTKAGTKAKAATSIAQTPAVSRVVGTGKENQTPGTTSSRKSKEAAAARLHEMTPDIALYEKERKRVGGVVYGGRRKNGEDRVDASRKRSAEPEMESSARPDPKRQRTESASIRMHLLISGYKAWVGKARKEDEEINKLRELGIVVVDHPAKATHMAVPNIVRTPKFLCALAFAPKILSTDYIQACLEQEEYLEPADYELVDKDYEKKNKFSLERSLEKARANKGQLLKGTTIFCVEKIAAGFEVLSSIAEANGASLIPYRGRQMTIVSRRAGSPADADDHPDNNVYLISNDNEEDRRLWPKFVKTAEDSQRAPYILISEWLLSSALRQEIQPLERYSLKTEA